jgi:hypothetical protein
MTKYYPGTAITYTAPIYNNGVLATPTTITFQYKEGRDGAWTSVTPATSTTGIYTATVTPLYGGALYWQWKTTGPAIVSEGFTLIEKSEFSYYDAPPINYDYGRIY